MRLRSRASSSWRDESLAPPAARAPGHDRAGHRPAEPAQPRARAAAGRAGAATARPRPDRPSVSQLMRLDRWKDPHTALEAFARVREELPELQLVLGVRARPRGVLRGEGDHRLRRRAGGPAPAHQLLGPGQPGDRGAEPALPRGHPPFAARGLRARGLRGAVARHARGGRPRGRHAAAGARRGGRLSGRRRRRRCRPGGRAGVAIPAWRSRWAAPAAVGSRSAS